MKFKVSTQTAVKAEAGSAGFIYRSGVYDVTINFASVETTKNGANQLNLNVTLPSGETQTVYGPYLTKNDGSENTSGIRLLNALSIIAGLGEGDELTIEEETHNVGKDNKPKDFNVIQEFSNLPIKLRVQRTYTKYQGEIKVSPVLRSFFRADGASAAEIVEGGEVGTRLALELEKYNTDSYQDGVTQEEAEAFEASRSKKGDTTGAPKPKVVSKSKPTLFA